MDNQNEYKINQERLAIEYLQINEKRKHKKKRNIILTIVLIMCLIIVGTITIKSTIISNKYKKAVSLVETDELAEAYLLFLELGDYKDSADKANDIFNSNPQLRMVFANKGDIIKYGTYEQDNVMSNGKEEIEWIVLENCNNKILVISKQILNFKPFHTSQDKDIMWENCSMRKWVNNAFFNDAFTLEEQKNILTSNISTPKGYHGGYGGNDTNDKIFLLSRDEVTETYFKEYDDRKADATNYALAQVSKEYSHQLKIWWTRSKSTDITAHISDGAGMYMDEIYGVRPSMWIDTTQF